MIDVIVVGLGGMGSAAAYHLARRGIRVFGIERFVPGHRRGSSFGHSRVIRQAYFEHPDYVPLLLRAYELWRELETESRQSLLTITGGLMIGAADSPVVVGSSNSATIHGLPHELLDAKEIRKRFPPLRPTDSTVGLYEKMAGVVRPEAAIKAHCELAGSLGATLCFNERVIEWKAEDNRVRVDTDKGTYFAKKLIIAPGAWAPQIFNVNLPLKITRQTMYWFEPTIDIEAFHPSRFPVYIWQDRPGAEFYGFPATLFSSEPRGVKVAYFYRDNIVSPEESSHEVSQTDIDEMRSALADRIPSLNGRLLHATTCLYTETPDHHFVIAQHPHHSNVTIASPCSGHGYKFCSVVGEVLADLACDGRSSHSIGLFQWNRWDNAIR